MGLPVEANTRQAVCGACVGHKSRPHGAMGVPHRTPDDSATESCTMITPSPEETPVCHVSPVPRPRPPSPVPGPPSPVPTHADMQVCCAHAVDLFKTTGMYLCLRL